MAQEIWEKLRKFQRRPWQTILWKNWSGNSEPSTQCENSLSWRNGFRLEACAEVAALGWQDGCKTTSLPGKPNIGGRTSHHCCSTYSSKRSFDIFSVNLLLDIFFSGVNAYFWYWAYRRTIARCAICFLLFILHSVPLLIESYQYSLRVEQNVYWQY